MAKASRKASSASAASKDGGEETVSGYFRRVVKENPKLLRVRSNQALLDRWLQDHPGEQEVPKQVKAGLMNVKSVLRSKRRKKRAAKQDEQPAEAATSSPARKGTGGLERLEES